MELLPRVADSLVHCDTFLSLMSDACACEPKIIPAVNVESIEILMLHPVRYDALIHRPERMFAQVQWNDELGHFMLTYFEYFSRIRSATSLVLNSLSIPTPAYS